MRGNALTHIIHHVKAFIFDLDGVVTRTAAVHARAWKKMFDDYLDDLGNREGKKYRPFDITVDYSRYVDGIPRYDGVKHFLESRGIQVPYGAPDDSPDQETVCGLGNRKNRLFLEYLREGVKVYDSTVSFIRKLKAEGIKTAVVSSSKNCSAVLEAAGITDLFDTRVDGLVSEELDLAGKPQPDIFVEASKRLGVKPEEGCAVEDAVSGVEAAYRGKFRYVIGMDRLNQTQALLEHGADIVVHDLLELEKKQRTSWLSPALKQLEDIADRLTSRQWALFLDYDGTLTPIVSQPDQAVLSEQMRKTLQDLASQKTVAVISGRDLQDVSKRVGIDNIFCAGSHGFEIQGPGGRKFEHDQATKILPVLDEAESSLQRKLQVIPGAGVERKKFSIAVHYRQVNEENIPLVDDIVKETERAHSRLRLGTGKKVYELQPDVEWNKGRALLWMKDKLGLQNDESLSVYIGDDTTDEDAFKVLSDRDIGIVVHQGTPKLTFADYILSNNKEVQDFLDYLGERIKGGSI
ncbi:MAG: trehalose-phosphatase [Thermodesulfobacteriota bacterium]